MDEVAVVGLDLAKQVFQVHGADGEGKKLFNRKLRREEVQDFFATLGPCTVAMEAGSASHFWARKIGALGHRTIILPGQYVKPFVKRDKSDALDAQAIAVRSHSGWNAECADQVGRAASAYRCHQDAGSVYPAKNQSISMHYVGTSQNLVLSPEQERPN